MIPDDKRAELENRTARLDRFARFTGIGALVAMVGLLVFVIVLQFQTQAQITATLENLKASAATNHKKTQNYVLCVAEATSKPLAERAQAFNDCGIMVDPNGDTAKPTTPAATSTQKPEKISSSNQVTTSGGPDPGNRSEAPSTPTTSSDSGQTNAVHGIPVVGNLLDKLGL